MSRRKNAKGSLTRYSANSVSSKRIHTDHPPHPLPAGYQLPGCPQPLGLIKISTKQHLGVRVTARMLGSLIIAKLELPTPLLEVYMEITETEFVKTNSSHSKMLKKTKWYRPIQTSRLVAIMARSLTTLKIQSFFTRCSVLITSCCVQSLNATVSAIQSLTNGMFYGALPLARAIFMRD